MKSFIAPVMMMLSLVCHANPVKEPPLDQVMFQISSKDWVTTDTAVVNVNVNATLNNKDLAKARSDIMNRFSKIAEGQWHITSFHRSQDQSGLEKLSVYAQARIPQSSLSSVYENAKSVSQPGMNYAISNIEFQPSLEEVQAVKAKVREQLYQGVKAEISRINLRFPDQKYSLLQLMFVEGEQSPMPAQFAKVRRAKLMAAAPAPSLSVSNKVIMTAIAIAASNREIGK